MTDTTAAGRKTDPFEDILLAEARMIHAEMQLSFTSMRTCEDLNKQGKMSGYDMLENWQREFSNARYMVDDTVKLARTAALLRGQRITVTRKTEEGEGGDSRNSIPQENIAAPALLEAAE